MKLFITGTDTDCGKTYVTCQLLDYFKAQQRPALALKPIASGCVVRNGQLQSEDVEMLQNHNCDSSLSINGWKFAPPISPHLAAKAVYTRLSAAEIADFCFNTQFADFDPLLIEGAGGLMVPLNEQETWLDFLRLTKIQVVVVVAMRLGCINHALLTASALRTNQIKTVGWIANCLDKNMLVLDENRVTLEQKMQMPLLGVLPYQGKFNPRSPW
ncbi:MAG: dethiobiotin synthase [Tatlockia sp.]|nr:dethiobiotin synthase [Tatlockia sp.]